MLGKRPLPKPHPLGPLVVTRSLDQPILGRVYAMVMLAGCVALLGVAWTLTPSPAGFGTHEQLGFSPCVSVVLTGYPCPTCGMTTAFAHAVHGELFAAFHTQPAGLGLTLLTMIGTVTFARALVTGRYWSLNWYRVSPARVIVYLLVLIVAGWAYKLLVILMMGVR